MQPTGRQRVGGRRVGCGGDDDDADGNCCGGGADEDGGGDDDDDADAPVPMPLSSV